jgi:hypothetical protein
MFVLSVRYGFEMRIILVHMLKYALSRCDTQTYGDIWESALSHYLKYGIYLDKSVSDLLLFFHCHETSLYSCDQISSATCNHALLFL